ncbi:uncharacterized protein PGTG_03503 [Puccinia graminis f. sp. tritici CRL 75-36-700-3]|uniref:Uncharacterized protein n=1 Tax=Puccinia graminis f. sp. tritici (strain CRL 75-36-700-3 / race SCCL) TaxID=418459 RepID=E3JZS2_PUCGT|nr:uncharacterized protein PGTG_03503 [Puccinia graminis f. sp. tritici CRL 75-36-700-3]EFP77547.2 hypothetical protein PGTG_03503 [Puccinia graminis f. sp. tritici CRL 75-36-700-3]
MYSDSAEVVDKRERQIAYNSASARAASSVARVARRSHPDINSLRRGLAPVASGGAICETEDPAGLSSGALPRKACDKAGLIHRWQSARASVGCAALPLQYMSLLLRAVATVRGKPAGSSPRWRTSWEEAFKDSSSLYSRLRLNSAIPPVRWFPEIHRFRVLKLAAIYTTSVDQPTFNQLSCGSFSESVAWAWIERLTS